MMRHHLRHPLHRIPRMLHTHVLIVLLFSMPLGQSKKHAGVSRVPAGNTNVTEQLAGGTVLHAIRADLAHTPTVFLPELT